MKKLYLKEAISSRILMIDGISRAGKMLTSKLVSNFHRVEYFQSYEPVEHTPFLWWAGLLGDDDAIALLRVQFDTAIYNRAFGRNMNLRLSDSSSIHLAANYADYARRAIDPGSDGVIDRYKDEGWLPLFMTHEMMPHISLFFSTIEDLRIIEVVRHPVDVAFSWNRRGWGKRWGTDPLALTLTLLHGDHAVPWFADEFADDYLALPPMDRVIRSILALQELCDASYERLSEDQRGRFHFLPYERLMTAPAEQMEKLADFLGTRPLEAMPWILARERVPDSPRAEIIRKRLSFIEGNAAPELVDRLLAVARVYENRWGIEPVES